MFNKLNEQMKAWVTEGLQECPAGLWLISFEMSRSSRAVNQLIQSSLICFQDAGRLALGTIRTLTENKYTELIWQLAWFLVFTIAGSMLGIFGMQGFL